jgi:hypothetical protein
MRKQKGTNMSKINVGQNLYIIVSEWLENYDFDQYTLDHEELTDAVVDKLRYDYDWDEEIDTDDIDLEAYTKDYEK